MSVQSTQNLLSCKPLTLLMCLCAISAQAAPSPLLVIDPLLVLQPSHRRNALDSNGGASVGFQTNAPNLRTRPQTFGLGANVPLIRDPENTQSGWGLGMGLYVVKAYASKFLKSYNSQSFEISAGRSTIVRSLEESVGLQGFFESGMSFTSLEAGETTKHRSIFLRFGAMSLKEGRGIVEYKPHRVDHSVVSSFVFPLDGRSMTFSVTHMAQVSCFWSQLRCGTTVSYAKHHNLVSLSGFEDPKHWLSYGAAFSMYFWNRSVILRSQVLWDAIRSETRHWHHGAGIPTVNANFAMMF